jgi:hypothetical protein
MHWAWLHLLNILYLYYMHCLIDEKTQFVAGISFGKSQNYHNIQQQMRVNATDIAPPMRLLSA